MAITRKLCAQSHLLTRPSGTRNKKPLFLPPAPELDSNIHAKLEYLNFKSWKTCSDFERASQFGNEIHAGHRIGLGQYPTIWR
jgi:hypothetical protein